MAGDTEEVVVDRLVASGFYPAAQVKVYRVDREGREDDGDSFAAFKLFNNLETSLAAGVEVGGLEGEGETGSDSAVASSDDVSALRTGVCFISSDDDGNDWEEIVEEVE